MPGFRYCDLLLTAPERAAWQCILPLSSPGNAIFSAPQDARTLQLQACRGVSQRAAQTFEWAQAYSGASLLALALDHLTQGRAMLYGAILKDGSFDSCHSFLQNAVDGLHCASTQHHLPRGLLTRAWLRSLAGPRTGPESAQSDLDEAWEIAERGPMPLFPADIHLYRARLFFREAAYPWDKHPDGAPRGPKDDLADAECLIKKHGYHRRDEELADAKQAILGMRPPT